MLLGTHSGKSAETQINITSSLDQEHQNAVQLTNGTLVFVFEDQSVTNGRVLLRRFDTNLQPLGAEQLVTGNNGERREPVITALSNGGFVVAYAAGNLDGVRYGVAFRRFDANAVPLDMIDVQVNSFFKASQFRPQVAALTNGGFVIAWVGQSGGTGQEIFYRRFDASGTALDAGDVPANALGADPVTEGDQGNPRVATLANGDFVIVYEDRATDDLYGIRILPDGNAMDAPDEPAGHKQFPVNLASLNVQSAPAIAALTNGGFVITYNTEPDGTAASRRVVGRIFSPAGVGGGEFLVGSHSNRWQDSRVAGLRNGDFVVAWQAREEGADAGTNTWSIFEQRFSPAGTPRFLPFLVNEWNTGDQSRPSITPFQSSGYAIAWSSSAPDGSGYGVFARAFLPNNEIPGRLSIIHAPITASISVDFTGQAGRDHELQASSNLTAWTTLLTTNSPSGTFRYFQPGTNQARFFRVKSL